MSSSARDDLIDAAGNAALTLLKKEGGIYPFAMVILPSGEHELVSYKSESPDASPTQVKEGLERVLRDLAQKGEICGAALAFLGGFGRQGGAMSDAIILLVDGPGWEASNFYIPYKKQFLGGYKTLDPLNQKTGPIFWLPA